ncbi:efflux RND transporter periplasmic adaptor subunit [Aliiglaciecola sp. CAU 1673]|uniref:efflux RND transporter periplasmic adaptor subunit n=1 Tax=Aliiglaciecola sp. CAU 1673 TaxID=3032595 RepID=UPI0023DA398E|nr:efflux RND transporter periplasmic adaptor subunit [Aliiglaciecola sp. CAU 1673]MDF2177678.1 efflux RND transporter periplasmic adaptor subunit [Aliiglaciecola sp. CAU 1673]
MKSLKPLMLSAVVLSGSVMAQEPPKPPPALVVVDSIRQEAVFEQLWVPGTVISRSDAQIAAEVAGRILRLAEVGDVVEAGDVLVQLDDEMLRMQALQHEANIAKWSARVELAQRKQHRFQTMAAKNAASKDQLDEILSELEIARQELTQAQISKRQTEYQLAQTQVKAPFRAVVAQRLKTPGEYTSVGQLLLRVVDTDNVEASVKAPLSVSPYLQMGMPVEISANGKQVHEEIRTIVPVGNGASRMMEVRVALTPGDFAIGSAVRVALPKSALHDALTVPRDALVLRQDGTFVYTVGEQNLAMQVRVSTGVGMGDRIEVQGDLASHNLVVVRGAERLREGQEVRFEAATEVAKLED